VRYSSRVRALLLIVITACGSGDATPTPPQQPPPKPPQPQPTPPSDTPASYVGLCAPCHGPTARGYVADHAPSLVSPTFLESASDTFLADSIAFGRPGTAMAAYAKERGGPLERDAIDALVRWLRGKAPPSVSLAAPGAGDARRGGPLYVKHCLKCHGDARTRGEGVHLANPQFLTLASDAFVRHAIVNGRPGTPMEGFAGKLAAAEIDDIVAFVRDFARQLDRDRGRLPAPTGKEPLVINPSGKEPSFALRADACPKDQPKCTRDPRYVPADQVKRALDDKRRLVIIDARPTSEWMTVHVTGAVSIPHHAMDRLDEIPKDVWVVAYCACPHHLSGIVVDELRKRGHAKAAVLDEGILEWQRRKYPVIAAAGVEAPPEERKP
jgi:mono/diheme cytochrome c family protein/rhodanese-related sulfurtransferase